MIIVFFFFIVSSLFKIISFIIMSISNKDFVLKSVILILSGKCVFSGNYLDLFI